MRSLYRLAIVAALPLLGACAVTPLEQAAAGVARSAGAEPDWNTTRAAAAPPERALDPESAVVLAFARNPEIRRQYALLGIAQSELEDAARIANPRLGLAWADPNAAGPERRTQSLTASFAELLLLPSQRRLSQSAFRQVELQVVHALAMLSRDVEIAWHDQLAAAQRATLAAQAADAAGTAEQLAGRYREAGNITDLQLQEVRRRAAAARIAALRARAAADAARARLADLLGLRTADAWRTTEHVAPAPAQPLSAPVAAAAALEERRDHAAAREAVAMREDALRTTRRWRWLGLFEAGFERERDTDGSTLKGPAFVLELPLFDQHQGAVARAKARLIEAQARRDALALSIENEISAAASRLESTRRIALEHGESLLPAAAETVRRRSERVNYMLDGVFTLLAAKEEEYEARAAWLESLRDYWSARAALRAAAGGALPGDDQLPEATIGAEEEAPAGDGHAHHGEGP